MLFGGVCTSQPSPSCLINKIFSIIFVNFSFWYKQASYIFFFSPYKHIFILPLFLLILLSLFIFLYCPFHKTLPISGVYWISGRFYVMDCIFILSNTRFLPILSLILYLYDLNTITWSSWPPPFPGLKNRNSYIISTYLSIHFNTSFIVHYDIRISDW